jgi:enamine deaminase RidA (YjgF/YER057c/UK114 family)
VSVEHVNPPELAPPAGFAHAVIGAGTTVFLAGQTALDGSGRLVGTNMAEQFEQALTNLLTALRAAGGAPDQLASLTIYVTDMDGYRGSSAEIGTIWRRLVGRTYPAMAAIGVSRLWDAQALVELQGFAVL